MSISFNPDSIQRRFDVSRETINRLIIFHGLLVHWQKNINLIAPSTVDDIWQRHIADSLFCCKAAGHVQKVIDVGSGAGFPGLIHAILLAEMGGGRVELVESSGKKCAFLKTVIRETGIRDSGVEIAVHNDRIENVLSSLKRPDIISARALASLDTLFTMTQFFLTKQVTGLFPKGRDHLVEIEAARLNWDFDCETINNPAQPESVVLKITGLKPL